MVKVLFSIRETTLNIWKEKLSTTLQSMMSAKFCQQRFCPCHKATRHQDNTIQPIFEFKVHLTLLWIKAYPGLSVIFSNFQVVGYLWNLLDKPAVMTGQNLLAFITSWKVVWGRASTEFLQSRLHSVFSFPSFSFKSHPCPGGGVNMIGTWTGLVKITFATYPKSL